MRTHIAVSLLMAAFATAGARADSGITKISLERTACYGTCPVYKLTVYRSGRVEFQGTDHVRQKGSRRGKISSGDFDKLVKKIKALKFFDLNERYDGKRPDGSGVTVTDLPTRKTSVTKGDHTKTVENYFRGPPGLKELEDLIDQLTRSARWIDG